MKMTDTERRDTKLFSLRRITSSGAFIPEIDGLRFIAIAAVVIYHLQFLLTVRFGFSDQEDWFTRIVISNGVRGVPLFFVISGFILALPFATYYLKAGPAISLREYFLRRVTRLEPPYIISMLMMFVMFSISGHRGHTSAFWFARLCASLLYLHNIIFGTGSSLNGVAWSLEIEIQFYCLVPLLTLVFVVRNAKVRRGVMLGVILCASLTQLILPDSPRLHLSIANYLQFFVTGLLLADFFVADWQNADKRRWAWDLIGVLVGPLVFCVDAEWFGVLGPFLIFVAYAAVFRGKWLRWVLTRPFVTLAGGMCYSIYLFHFPLMAKALLLSSRLFPHVGHYLYFSLQLTLMAIVIGAFCTIFFLLIERPCMKRDWPQQLWSKLHDRGRGDLPLALVQEDSVQPAMEVKCSN